MLLLKVMTVMQITMIMLWKATMARSSAKIRSEIWMSISACYLPPKQTSPQRTSEISSLHKGKAPSLEVTSKAWLATLPSKNGWRNGGSSPSLRQSLLQDCYVFAVLSKSRHASDHKYLQMSSPWLRKIVAVVDVLRDARITRTISVPLIWVHSWHLVSQEKNLLVVAFFIQGIRTPATTLTNTNPRGDSVGSATELFILILRADCWNRNDILKPNFFKH